MKRSSLHHDSSRSGIALIIVLGMLALLVLLGTGFAVYMRTERLSAKAFADSVKGRHLLQVAMARAMDDIDANLIATNFNVYPLWPNLVLPSAGYGSTGLSDLLTGDATNFIPGSLLADAQSELGNVQWETISDPDSGQVIGRYAYMALDCSGFIDVSIASRPQAANNRSNGRDVSQIVLDGLGEFSGNADTFLNGRQNRWKRFESLPDIWAVGSGQGLGIWPFNVFHYSHFPPQRFWDGTDLQPRLDIGGTDSDWTQADVVQALQDSGVANATEVYNSMVDFVDQGVEPQDIRSSNVEPVPMINEVIVTNRLEKLGDAGNGLSTFRATLRIDVEVWYPFEYNGSETSFDLREGNITVSLAPGAPPIFAPIVPTTPAAGERRINVSGPGFPDPMPYITYTATADLPSAIPDGFPVPLRVSIERLEIEYGGTAVDVAENLEITYPTARAYSCLDPRLNHDASQWVSEGETPLAVNGNTRNFNGGDGDTITDAIRFLAPNRSFESVAELGYISTGNPWETVALYRTADGRFNPVLDYFRIGPEPTTPTSGLINVNSPFVEVLAAGLQEAPIEKLPGNESIGPMSAGAAIAYANELINKTQTSFVTNIATFGELDRAFFEGNISGSITDAEIESIIRNSYELFSVRQNMFTILLVAEALTEDGAGNQIPVAQQRGVAVVWRDPFPNSNDNHAMFVRFFKPLID